MADPNANNRSVQHQPYAVNHTQNSVPGYSEFNNTSNASGPVYAQNTYNFQPTSQYPQQMSEAAQSGASTMNTMYSYNYHWQAQPQLLQAAYPRASTMNTMNNHSSYSFRSQAQPQTYQAPHLGGSFYGGPSGNFGSSIQGAGAYIHPAGASFSAPNINTNNTNVYNNYHNSVPPATEGRNRVPIPRMTSQTPSRPASSQRSTQTRANATPTPRNGSQAQPGSRSTNPQQSYAPPGRQPSSSAMAPASRTSVNPQDIVSTTREIPAAGRTQSLSINEALGRVNATRTPEQMASPTPMQGRRPLPTTQATQAQPSLQTPSRPPGTFPLSQQYAHGFTEPPPNSAYSNSMPQNAVSPQTAARWAQQYAQHIGGPAPSMTPQQNAESTMPSQYEGSPYSARPSLLGPGAGQLRSALGDSQGQSEPRIQRVDAGSQRDVQPTLYQPHPGAQRPTDPSPLGPGAGVRRRASVEGQGPREPQRRRVDGGPQPAAQRVQQTAAISNGSSAAPPPLWHPADVYAQSITRDTAAHLEDQRLPSPQPVRLPAAPGRGESNPARSPTPKPGNVADTPEPVIPYSDARLESELQYFLSQPAEDSHKTPRGHATATERPTPHITQDKMADEHTWPPPGFTQAQCQVTERAKAYDAIGRADNLIANPEPGDSYYKKRLGSDVPEWLRIRDKSTTCITNPYKLRGALKAHPTAYHMQGYENVTRGSVEMQMLARRLKKESEEGDEASAYQFKAMIDTGRMFHPDNDRMAQVAALEAASAAKGNNHKDEESSKDKEDKDGKDGEENNKDGDDEDGDGEKNVVMGGTSPYG